MDRIIPSVLVNMGDLIGLIYRSNRGPAGEAKQYLHLFDLPPRLACAPDGKRLFVLGGNYRVGRRGIEG